MKERVKERWREKGGGYGERERERGREGERGEREREREREGERERNLEQFVIAFSPFGWIDKSRSGRGFVAQGKEEKKKHLSRVLLLLRPKALDKRTSETTTTTGNGRRMLEGQKNLSRSVAVGKETLIGFRGSEMP